MTTHKPVVLCILDGWGLRDSAAHNAVALAKTPNYDRLMARCANATLKTSGADVGLPDGQMGNSEVGHMNIGAGRIVLMDLGQIDQSIKTGAFAANKALNAFIARLLKSGGTAHLLGVVSDGGVHGHLTHLIAAVKTIAAAGVPVNIHAITDGRDVPPGTAAGFLATLQDSLPGNAKITSVSGRYFALDRDQRWERVEKAFQVMMAGQGNTAKDVASAINDATANGESDEFITPTVLSGHRPMQDGDGLLCLNFRADRAREILAAILDPTFDGFATGARPNFAAALGMSNYSTAHDTYMEAMFPKQKVVNTLGHWVALQGKRQFRLAETEKYPHVTFFMNGGVEPPEQGEDRFMPQSPKVATYDLQPEMSSAQVTERFVSAIKSNYDLIIVNYANPDMVGHTGDLNAAIKACEAVDSGLGQVVEALTEVGGAMIVTADHGNCETMVDPMSGQPHTAHTTNPVPVILLGGPAGTGLRAGGRLADLAPSLLELMQIKPPVEMTGKSLLT